MRLKSEQIEKISKSLYQKLSDKKLITPRVTGDKVIEKIKAVITKNLQDEDQLEKDAQKLLSQYRGAISSGQMDEHKALMMIKKQLAKERKMIL